MKKEKNHLTKAKIRSFLRKEFYKNINIDKNKYIFSIQNYIEFEEKLIEFLVKDKKAGDIK